MFNVYNSYSLYMYKLQWITQFKNKNCKQKNRQNKKSFRLKSEIIFNE